METLDRHKSRVQELQDALERLMALHLQIYDLQGEIVAISKSEVPDRNERLVSLRKKVQDLRPEIERARKQLAKP